MPKQGITAAPRTFWTHLILGSCCIGLLGYSLFLRNELAKIRAESAKGAPPQASVRGREKGNQGTAGSKGESAPAGSATKRDDPAFSDSGLSAEGREALLRMDEEEIRNQNRLLVRKKSAQKTMQRGYAYILESLGPLDPMASARLKDVLVEREQIIGDIRRQALLRGIPLDGAEYEQIKAQTLAGPNADIQAILGEKSAQFFELDRDYAAGVLIDLGMRYNFEFADVPLDRETTLKLARVMTDLNYAMNDPKYPALIRQPINPETGLTPLYAQLLARSASFLSPRQLEVLRAQQDEVLANLNQ
jgi:hypothetical protein